MFSEHMVGAVFSALPRYQFLDTLGRGGMGVVYKALDLELEEPVALKVLWDTPRDDHAEMLARFKAEVSLSRRIKHPSVCRIHDFGVSEQFAFLTMEFVPGVDLGRVIRDGAVPIRRSLHLLRQIAEGVAAAHAVGVLHRDLKPQNVMVRPDDGVTILDFGLAREKMGRGITHLGNAVGTPHYMSPEQALGRELDERSDLYSIGVVGFELLTGGPMYVAGSGMAVARLHVEEPVPVERLTERRVPREVSAVVLRCLRKVPAERFASVAELATQLSRLEAISEEGRSSPAPPSTAVRPQDVPTAVKAQPVEPLPLDLEIDVPEPVGRAAATPVAAAVAVPVAAPSPPPLVGPGRRPVVLVVDDDPVVCRIVALHLTTGGFDPITASSGVEAIQLLSACRADAVLMDVQMPGMDGFDAIRILKAIPQNVRLPVFLMSSFSEKNRVAFAGQTGAVRFFQKPLDMKVVVAELRSVLAPGVGSGGPGPG